jgi:hypothetical protein
MKAFKINKLVCDEIKDFKNLPKMNESECDDILSQIIFRNIDQYAFQMCGSLHNAIFDKRDILPFLILCLEDEISNQNLPMVTVEDIDNALNNTKRLFSPPNIEFKQVVTMKTYPKRANINGELMKVHFNPYMIALFISDMYYKLYHNKSIKDWCTKGHIKFESIEKIAQIINDKYSYRFVEIAEISFEMLTKIFNSDGKKMIAKYEEFLGIKGTDLIKHFTDWSKNYHVDLLNVIQGLFGNLKYS